MIPVGTWSGFTLPGFDNSTLLIKKDIGNPDKYFLHFVRETDFGNFRAERSATFNRGALVLNKPIDKFGGTTKPYARLYPVHIDGLDYLLPSNNVLRLKTKDQFRTRSNDGFAYRRVPVPAIE
jgi:hypothetical protein